MNYFIKNKIFFLLCLAIISLQVLFSLPAGADASVYDNNTAAAQAGENVKHDYMPSEKASWNINVGAYCQLWYIYESVENEKLQSISGDNAADKASGFNINRARLYLSGNYGNLRGKLSLRVERGTPGLMDAFAEYSFFNGILQITAGQMKIPSTREVEVSSASLDFATRTVFSSNVTNWSLSKSISSVSPFTSIKTYLRDTGIALKGDVSGFHYFLMVGNGLGANLFIGGEENRQFVYTNSFGAYFYGLRLSYNPVQMFKVPDLSVLSVRFGGHFNYNRHPDILYNDRSTVLDIDRYSWSCDMDISVFDRILLGFMYGGGAIRDDFDNNDETDYKYSGFEAKIIAVMIKDHLEAGFRFDSYTYENAVFGGRETTYTYTIGITCSILQYIRIQANYKIKTLNSTINNDLNDNIFILQMQFHIN